MTKHIYLHARRYGKTRDGSQTTTSYKIEVTPDRYRKLQKGDSFQIQAGMPGKITGKSEENGKCYIHVSHVTTQDSPPKLEQQPWTKMTESEFRSRAQTMGCVVKSSHWGLTAMFEGYQAGEWTKAGVGWLATKPTGDALSAELEQFVREHVRSKKDEDAMVRALESRKIPIQQFRTAMNLFHRLGGKQPDDLSEDADVSTRHRVLSHPQYTKADYDYLIGKGYSLEEILRKWDEERYKPPQQHSNKPWTGDATLTFVVAEVEHGGDEENSIADLRRAGCGNIQVTGRNYGNGVIRVTCTPPAGVTSKEQLQAKLTYAVLDASSGGFFNRKITKYRGVEIRQQNEPGEPTEFYCDYPDGTVAGPYKALEQAKAYIDRHAGTAYDQQYGSFWAWQKDVLAKYPNAKVQEGSNVAVARVDGKVVATYSYSNGYGTIDTIMSIGDRGTKLHIHK